ncbi:MAG: segregation and condensation protein B, partial [Candidatus Omnitrophota bacterium]
MNTDQDNQEDIQEGEDQVAVIDTKDNTQEALETVATNLHVRNVIETLLYVNEKPITLEQFKKVLPTVTGPEIKRAVKHLIDEYEARNQGMVVVELGGGFQMLSNPHFASYVRDFYKTK